MNKIAITTGDLLGIGHEIVEKALLELKLPKENVIIVGKKVLDYPCVEIDDSDNGTHCYQSLIKACDMAKRGAVQAIVTAPVSKEALYKSGYKFSGQTEILQENLKGTAEMLFVAGDLKVMLLTRHIALKDIASSINEKMIIEKTMRLREFLSGSPKIAFCALNPHAGENGILGSEENEIIKPALIKLRKLGVDVIGPLSADGLFASVGKKYLNGEKQQYDAIIATYHDQALGAVKAIAFDKVVNTTIGLEVLRTSPSSGTAYDIANKGIANPQSMIEAIKQSML